MVDTVDSLLIINVSILNQIKSNQLEVSYIPALWKNILYDEIACWNQGYYYYTITYSRTKQITFV